MASIRKRGENSYRITVSLGYTPDGKKLKRTKTVKLDPGLTERQREKELQRQATLFEEAVQRGTYFEPSHFTVSTFAEKWIEEHGKSLANKTKLRYEGILKGRVAKALGHLKLEQLKPMHLLEFYGNLQEDGIREDGRGGRLSNSTIQYYHRVLSAMLADAVRWGLLKENPCEKVKPPKITSKEMPQLDEGNIRKLLAALETEPLKYRAIIELALVTGCRRGELVALQWKKHIDLDDGTLHIQQSVEYTPATGVRIKPPKTRSSVRQIAIPASTVQLLKQYRKWQLEQKIKIGDLWQKEEKVKQGDLWEDPEWVFATWDGYIIHPDSVTSIFNKFLKRHNLPHIRFHDLRHLAATILIHEGLNVRAVAGRMGHANPDVTLRVYSHVLQSADRQAADIMEGIFKKNSPTDQKQA